MKTLSLLHHCNYSNLTTVELIKGFYSILEPICIAQRVLQYVSVQVSQLQAVLHFYLLFHLKIPFGELVIAFLLHYKRLISLKSAIIL